MLDLCSHIHVAKTTLVDEVFSSEHLKLDALQGKSMVKLDGNWRLERRLTPSLQMAQRSELVSSTLKRLRVQQFGITLSSLLKKTSVIVTNLESHVEVLKEKKRYNKSREEYLEDQRRIYLIEQEVDRLGSLTDFSNII